MKDAVTFSGTAFKQMINDWYKENKIIRGEMKISGQIVDLTNIDCSTLVITSSRDELVLETQSLPIMDLISSTDKTYRQIEAGHVSLCLTGQFAYAIDSWLSERSEKI